MAVTETLRALGSWGITLTDKMPDDLWKRIDYFGHIVVHVGRRPGPLDDSLLRSARYVGPVTRISDSSAEQRAIGGSGMAMWLGDADGKGDVFTEAITVDGDFDDVIRELLPASGSVTEGTLFTTGETFGPSTFQYQTPREVIDYVCQTLGDHAWRVNGDGTLDAGLESDLFVTNPKCVVARKNFARTVAGFDDMFLRGLAGMAETERDVEDYGTGVVLLAQGINGQFVSAEEELTAPEIPFNDIHGNKVKRVRIIQESETDTDNAPARALLQLNRFKGTRDALTLTTDDYDIKGKAQVGDYLWVFDPSMDLVDPANEIPFRAQRINPFKLRLTETTWPVTNRMSVFYRGGTGEWMDLSKHFVPESGGTSLVVGGYNRSLSEGGSGTFPIVLPDINSSIPDQVQWDLPWVQSQYQSPVTGDTKAEVELKWLRPDNVDSSTIVDGAYYEIRYRQSATSLTDYTLIEIDGLTSDISDVNTLEDPLPSGIETQWQYISAPFEVLKFRLQELTPGMTYEAQVRAVDTGRPPNLGDWSVIEAWQASRDVFPPATPAPAEVASNPMAVLITHKLGRATGGEFNLDRDLAFLEFHGEYEPLFTPTEDTVVGRAPADWGNITGNIPVIANFQIRQVGPMYFKTIAVDQSGNRSLPSAAVVATAELITDAYIGNLNVGKLVSGTMTASVVNSGLITTGGNGARVDITNQGIKGINDLGQTLWQASNLTGKITVQNRGGIEIQDGALTIKNAAGQVIVELGECLDGRHGLQVYTDGGTRVARVGEIQAGGGNVEGIEVISNAGDLVQIDTLAFGMEAATVSGADNRIGVGFGDMVSFGPSTSVIVGNSVRMVVMISAWMSPKPGAAAQVGFDVNGPGGYFLGAAQLRSLYLLDTDSTGATTFGSASKVFLVEGLPTDGTYTVTMKYSSGSASAPVAQFADRHIVVMPF